MNFSNLQQEFAVKAAVCELPWCILLCMCSSCDWCQSEENEDVAFMPVGKRQRARIGQSDAPTVWESAAAAAILVCVCAAAQSAKGLHDGDFRSEPSHLYFKSIPPQVAPATSVSSAMSDVC